MLWLNEWFSYFNRVEEVVVGWIVAKVSVDVRQDHPGHGDEPDAVQAVQHFRILLGRYFKEGLGVSVNAEPEQKFFYKTNIHK